MKRLMIAPWILSLLTAIWYGIMGHKASGHWLRWALNGALFALVASTLVLGVCNAAFIPRSHEEYVSLQVKSLLLAFLPILLVGGSMMIMLMRKGPSGSGKVARP